MNTSSLVVELVIIGLQVLIWLFMVVGLLSGFQWIQVDRAEKLAAPLTILLVGCAYTIGIAFDAFTAWLEDKALGSSKTQVEREKQRQLRQQLRLQHHEVSQQLDNEQYLLRLLRSTTLNLTLIAILGIIFILRAGGLGGTEKWVYSILLAGVAAMGWYGWCRRRNNFKKNREVFYRSLGIIKKAPRQQQP